MDPVVQIVGPQPLPRGSRVDLRGLVLDAVASGASIGWVSVPSAATVDGYWREVHAAVRAGTTVLLVAVSSGRIVGSVQLLRSTRENGTHRGEVARLLVHTSARRRGVGTELMRAVEAEAASRGISLLVLDTRTGDPSQLLYEKLGWTVTGVIPDYARGTSGTLEPTTILFKRIAAG